MDSDPGRLDAEVATFLRELHDTLNRVLPAVPSRPFTVVADESDRHIAIRTAENGIPLTVDRSETYRLSISFRCMWDKAKTFLAIEDSEFKLGIPETSEPLLRFDYVRSADAKVPRSHIQVHAHRDETIYAMMMAGSRQRGSQRARRSNHGRIPRLADLHIPTGGPRF